MTLSKTALRGRAFLMAVLMTSLIVLSGCGNKDDDVPPAPAKSNAATERSTGLTMVSLADGSVFVGQVTNRASDGTVLVDDAYFIADSSTSSTEANVLRRFGTEVHKPKPMAVIPMSSILHMQSLTSSSPASIAIKSYSKKHPAGPAVESVFEKGLMTAVFLKSGAVYFGSGAIEGETLVLADAYYLAFRNKQAATRDEISSLDDLALIPQSESVYGGDGDLVIPLQSVLYFQTLEKDSPIIAAVKKGK